MSEDFNVTCSLCGKNWRGHMADLNKPIADCERMDCGLRSFRRYAVTHASLPAPLGRDDLVRDLLDEADLCRNDGATDIAGLLERAATALSARSGYVPRWKELLPYVRHGKLDGPICEHMKHSEYPRTCGLDALLAAPVAGSAGDGWISVETRLPEKNEIVVTRFADDSRRVSWHDGKRWCPPADERVTDWTPLPAASSAAERGKG